MIGTASSALELSPCKNRMTTVIAGNLGRRIGWQLAGERADTKVSWWTPRSVLDCRCDEEARQHCDAAHSDRDLVLLDDDRAAVLHSQ